ncbi:MAG: tetratricopeptide repeat protein [Gemmataceae bacterium]
MRRRLNLRLLLAVVVVGVVIGTTGFLVRRYQIHRNINALRNQAKLKQSRGEYDDAANLLATYVHFRPKDADATKEYGWALEKAARLPAERINAVAVLTTALQLDPNDSDTRRRVVALALELGRYRDALPHLDALTQRFPNDAEVERQRGECAEGLGDFDDAIKHYAAAIQRDRAHAPAYVRQANLLRRLDRAEQADALMADLRKAQSESVPALLALARYYRETGQAAAAAPDIAKALTMAPDSADVRLAAAEQALAQEYMGTAREQLRRGLENNPNDLRLLVTKSRLDYRVGKAKEAGELARRAAKLLDKNPRKFGDVLQLLVDVEERAIARELLASAEGKKLPAAFRDFLEARILLGDEDYSKARELLERSRAQLAATPDLLKQAHLMLGLCQRRLGNPEQAAKCYEAAADVDPAWAAPQLELAAANVERGQTDSALHIYLKWMPRVPTARLAAVRLLLVRALQQPPSRRKWDDVERLLAEAKPDLRRSVEWRLLRTEMQIAQGKADVARVELEAARAGDPDQSAYRLALVALAAHEQRPGAAAKYLSDAERDLGDRVDIRLARARLAATTPDAAKTLAKLAGGGDKFLPTDRIELLAGLYRVARTADAKLARDLGNRLAALTPQRVDLHVDLLNLALADRNEKAAADQVAKLRELEGEGGPNWRCGEVSLKLQFAPAADRSWLANARTSAADAARNRPDWPLPALLLGELDERLGDADSAATHYRTAVELGEREPGVVRRAVQLLQGRRRFDEAQELLRRLQDSGGWDNELERAITGSLVGSKKPEDLLEKARQLAPASSKGYRDHLWLAHMLNSVGGHEAEAAREYRKAVELGPDAAEAWVGLVFFLSGREDKSAAIAACDQAAAKLHGPDAISPLALCREAAGQIDKAEVLLSETMAKKPAETTLARQYAGLCLRTNQPGKAEPALRQLEEAGGENAGWARRHRALLLALRGNSAQIGEALPLIEQNLLGANATPEDERARAIVLALQPRRRREAIAALEASFKNLPATPDEQFLLARLYDVAGDWPRARELLAVVVGLRPRPDYLDYFIRQLLVQGEVAAAQLALTKLEQADPDDWRTTAAKARVLARTDRESQAETHLVNFVRSAVKPEQVLPAAQLLEELDRPRAAEQAYRRYAVVAGDQKPESGLPLARFLAGQGRLDEAMTLAEQAGPAANPDAVFAVSAALARNPQLTAEQEQRLARWLDAAQAKQGPVAGLLLARADLHEQRGRTAEAEATYREILQREPKQPAALNNFAVLLSLQGRATDALPLVEQAIKLIGSLPPLLDTRAVALRAAGKADAAVADLEEAVYLEPTASRWFHLAQAYKSKGDEAASVEALHKAMALKLTEAALHPLERESWRKTQAGIAAAQ